MRRMLLFALTLVTTLCGASCGRSIDLATGLRVDGLATGWLDAGLAQGLNKLVPAVSFALTNVSPETLPLLQVNAVFRRAGQTGEWGARFATAHSQGLAPGASTQTLTLASDLGYTGADPRDAMLHNTQFVDADVDLFAKYSSTQWVRLGTFRVHRQLIAALPR